MKVLFDQGTPVPLRAFLTPHTVDTAFELGGSSLQNGELLAAAEKAGYQLLVTTDQNLKHQQNLRGRKLAVLVLLSASWRRLNPRAQQLAAVIETMQMGTYLEFDPE